MKILKLIDGQYYSNEDIEEIERNLSDKFEEQVIIIPYGLEVVSGFNDTVLKI